MHCTVNCRVLPQLNHDVVLGVDWLQATNPSIDWQACMVKVDCGEHGGTHVLHALTTKPVAKVALCSIKQIERDMRLGCETWLMLIQPATHVVTTEADMCAEGVVVSDSRNDATYWNSIINEHSDGFEPPGMPAKHDTVHQIELEPGSVPPYKWQYRVSAAELAEVRQQLDKFLKKGWIHPS